MSEHLRFESSLIPLLNRLSEKEEGFKNTERPLISKITGITRITRITRITGVTGLEPSKFKVLKKNRSNLPCLPLSNTNLRCCKGRHM